MNPDQLQSYRLARRNPDSSTRRDLWGVYKSSSGDYSTSFGSVLSRFFSQGNMYTNRTLTKQRTDLSYQGFQNFIRSTRKHIPDHGYTDLLSCLFAPDYLAYYVDNLRNQGITPMCLDLLSGGTFLRSLGVSGVSVGLTDQRTNEEIISDSLDNRVLIAGDVLRRETWDSIEEYLVNNNLPGFNLITTRGLFAVMSTVFHRNPPIPVTPFVYNALLNRIYAVSDPNSSLMLMQAGDDSRYHIHEQIALATVLYQQTPGLQAFHSQGVSINNLLLHRTGGSPTHLPQLV